MGRFECSLCLCVGGSSCWSSVGEAPRAVHDFRRLSLDSLDPWLGMVLTTGPGGTSFFSDLMRHAVRQESPVGQLRRAALPQVSQSYCIHRVDDILGQPRQRGRGSQSRLPSLRKRAGKSVS